MKKRYLSIIFLSLCGCAFSCSCMEVEEENPCYGISYLLGEEHLNCLCATRAVAHLSRYMHELESTIDDIVKKKNVSTEEYTRIKELKDKITDCYSPIQHVIQQEINKREQEGKGAITLHEITKLLTLIVHEMEQVNKVLEKGVSPEAMDKNSVLEWVRIKKDILDAYSTVFDPLEMFFGLVNNQENAYKCCLHPSMVPALKESLRKPLILEFIRSRWYGQNGLADRCRSRLYSQIDVHAGALHNFYEQATTQSKDLRQQIKNLDKEIGQLQFEIYESYRKANEQKPSRASDQCRSRNTREDGIGERNKEIETQKISERDQLCKEIGDLYGNFPSQIGSVQGFSGGMCRSASPLGDLLKKVVELIISRSFLDDVHGNMIIAKGDRKYLLADLTYRLWMNSEQEIPSAALMFQPIRTHSLAIDSCIRRLADTLHTIIVYGRRNAHVLQEILQKINEGEKKARGLLPNYEKRVAGMVKAAERVGNSVGVVTNATYALGAAYTFLTNVLVPDIETGSKSDKEKKEAENGENGILSKKIRKAVFDQAERGVEYGGKAKEKTNKVVHKITELVIANRQNIDHLDAISLILKNAANSDPRTRNLGDGQFRQWFDQLGNTWDHPAQILGSE